LTRSTATCPNHPNVPSRAEMPAIS